MMRGPASALCAGDRAVAQATGRARRTHPTADGGYSSAGALRRSEGTGGGRWCDLYLALRTAPPGPCLGPRPLWGVDQGPVRQAHALPGCA